MDANAYIDLAHSHFGMGKFEEGIKAYEEAYEKVDKWFE